MFLPLAKSTLGAADTEPANNMATNKEIRFILCSLKLFVCLCDPDDLGVGSVITK